MIANLVPGKEALLLLPLIIIQQVDGKIKPSPMGVLEGTRTGVLRRIAVELCGVNCDNWSLDFPHK